jgi:glyoxylase-like metal-dependent hydrolase (beta-lactamase superfamily II)
VDDHLKALPRVEAETPERLRPVAAGLWACADEPLGGPANTCGFLLQRAEGNVFVYSCSNLDPIFGHLDELGGVALILLNHMDEATRHVTRLAEHYGIPVHTHRAEVEACEERGVRHIDPFDGNRRFGHDLEAIHAPGHTAGTTAYRWHNQADGRLYLFTGDTFTNFTIDRFPAVLGFHPYDTQHDDMIATLATLRSVDSDVLVPGLARGQINAYEWTTDERHRLMDHATAQLTA